MRSALPAALGGALLLVGLAAPAVAQEPAAPPVRPLPGPEVLHRPPLPDPALAPSDRWQAPPTGVSGTTVVRDGELVSTGWVYDDNGADTIPVPLLPILVDGEPSVRDMLFSTRVGDVVYPRDADRYAGNAADLVEVRVRVEEDAVAFRIVLNTVREPDVAAVALGIDVDGSDEVVDWGHGLGALGPTGIDRVLYTDGVTASLDGTFVPSRIDVDLGRIEVEVPRTLLDPASDAVWELFGVSGLADGEGGFVPIAPMPSATQPGGDALGTAPPVFDVAFRGNDQEPLGLLAPEALSGQAGAYGAWRDTAMARALARRDVSAFSAELDVALLVTGGEASDVPTSGTVNRLYASRRDLGGGVGPQTPLFRSSRQPYTLYVPSCVERGETPILTLALHSLLGNHNQYWAASPGFYEQLGEARCSLVVTTLGHGPDGWYLDDAEADLFEALADVLATYEVDLDHTLIHGYSMGGYGTYRLTGRYPDLFAAAFPVVGPPYAGATLLAGDSPLAGLGITSDPGILDRSTTTTPYLDSFRHVPTLAWHAAADELVPITSAVTHQQRQIDLGYRVRHEVHVAEHLTHAFLDRWERAVEVLGERPEREADPDHVTYRVLPVRDRADLGLRADHAYWVADVRARDADDLAGGLVDVRSFARGEGEPITETITDAGVGPTPYTARGVAWTGRTEQEPEDRLTVRLDNIASTTLHLEDRGLFTSDATTLEVDSDGPTQLTLVHDAGRIDLAEGSDVAASSVHDGWLVLDLEEGNHTLTLASTSAVGGTPDEAPAAGSDRPSPTPAADRPSVPRGPTTVAAGAPLPVTGGALPLGLVCLGIAAWLRRSP